MGRKNRARLAKGRDQRGPLQRIADQEAAEKAARPTLDPHTARHGDYERQGVVYVNRGGTPIARWIQAKLLSVSQLAAIEHCWRLWGKVGTSGSLVMDMERSRGGASHGDGMAQQEALDDLARIKGYIPAKYWSVFEAVCRDGEPAGFAGSRLASVRSDQVTAARVCVQFVADVIALRERLSY